MNRIRKFFAVIFLGLAFFVGNSFAQDDATWTYSVTEDNDAIVIEWVDGDRRTVYLDFLLQHLYLGDQIVALIDTQYIIIQVEDKDVTVRRSGTDGFVWSSRINQHENLEYCIAGLGDPRWVGELPQLRFACHEIKKAQVSFAAYKAEEQMYPTTVDEWSAIGRWLAAQEIEVEEND